MTNHIAAIHVLASKLEIAGGDYRALLVQLTGVDSCKKMTQAQRRQVREHLQGLAQMYGLEQRARTRARPLSAQEFERRRQAASPRERKVWAMWGQLARAGVVRSRHAGALNAWVRRQTGVDALRFCNGAQLDMLIEALKDWKKREGLP